MKIDPKQTVAQIASEHPEILKIFEKYRIDMCCGGKLPLETVALKHGFDLEKVLRELEAALPAPR